MKRVNPKTGKPFKRGDLREADGARFIRYNTARKKSDGYFIEDWEKPERRSGKGIKRINPHTGQIYHRGDTRDEDDKIFLSYRSRTKRNRDFDEVWVTPARFDELAGKLADAQKNYKKESRRLSDAGLLPKRTNPKTGVEFTQGDIRDEDGFLFVRYDKTGRTAGGYRGEIWSSPTAYQRMKVGNTYEKARRRAREKKIPFDLDVDFLLEIFPENGLCPITGEEMTWGGEKSNSPSLDRFAPDKGYTKGNVRWVLDHANLLKSDRNIELIEKIYFDMKKVLGK